MSKDKKKYFGDAILTPEFRVAFPNVFEVDEFGNFSITMLFPKSTDITDLKKGAKAIALEYFDEQLPKNFHWPFKDGDIPNDEGRIFDGYSDSIVLNAKTNAESRIFVIESDAKTEIIKSREFYAGCFARAKITPHAWSFKGKNGVSFFLGNIQKLRDGNPFGAFSDPKTDFTAVEPTEDVTPPSQEFNDEWLTG